MTNNNINNQNSFEKIKLNINYHNNNQDTNGTTVKKPKQTETINRKQKEINQEHNTQIIKSSSLKTLFKVTLPYDQKTYKNHIIMKI